MRIDVDRIEVPDYDGLLTGHHHKGPTHVSKRAGGTPDWLLVATLSGEGRFYDLPTEPGSLALVAPGTPHDYGTARRAGGWEILWVHFHPPYDWLEMLHWPLAAPGLSLVVPTNGPEVHAAFRDVLRQTHSTVRRHRQLAMNALERLLLLGESGLPHLGPPMDDRIRLAVEHIHAHLREPLSLESLGGLVYLSPSRFSHLFREETGLAPLQYVGQQRIDRARRLLERTTMSVGEIAAEVGMEPFHFSARFKAETGLSPRAYRAEAFTNRER